MPFGVTVSGFFTRLYNWVEDRDNGIEIDPTRMDAEMDGFAAGLTAIAQQTQPFVAPVKVAAGGSVSSPAFTSTLATGSGLYFHDTLEPALAWQGQRRLVCKNGNIVLDRAISGFALNYLSTVAANVQGTANAIIITNSGEGVTELIPGMTFSFIPASNNTGSVTINYHGRGVTPCVTVSGAALPAGYLVAGRIARVWYDGTSFVVDREPEVITNSNGRAIRYADGTQVCDFVYDATGDDWTNAIGSFFTAPASVVWTYPTTFSATPTVTIAAVRVSFHPFGAYMTSVATGSASWRPWSSISVAATNTKRIHMVARGMWY